MFLREVLCELCGKKGNQSRSRTKVNTKYHEGNPSTNLPHTATQFPTIISSGKKIQIKKIDLLMSQPVGMTILEYANKNIGFQWESEVYGAGTNIEFGIYWSYNHWGVI